MRVIPLLHELWPRWAPNEGELRAIRQEWSSFEPNRLDAAVRAVRVRSRARTPILADITREYRSREQRVSGRSIVADETTRMRSERQEAEDMRVDIRRRLTSLATRLAGCTEQRIRALVDAGLAAEEIRAGRAYSAPWRMRELERLTALAMRTVAVGVADGAGSSGLVDVLESAMACERETDCALSDNERS